MQNRADITRIVFGFALFLSAVSLASRPALAAYAAPIRCGGDCDRDRTVVVSELVTGVNIALGSVPLDQCTAFDCNGSGAVTVSCLVGAVGAALNGCPSNVADPTVEGPVTGGAGVPFVASTAFPLSDIGYQEAEYFVAGTASAYEAVGALTPDGHWTVVPGETASYRTRALVYRPIDAAAFNGTVLVEWLNVSGGLDAGPDWIMAHTLLAREGYAWVGVSAQRVGIEGGGGIIGLPSMALKEVDPERYASLVHPGDSFSYDIFSQVAQAIWHPRGTNLLAGLKPKRVIAMGESQSAFRMVTYVDGVHPLADIFDGFFIHSRGGGGAPLSEPPQIPIGTPIALMMAGDTLDVPVLTMQTETDLVLLGSYAARQPDDDHLRLWEVAGTAHADVYTSIIGREDRGDSPDAARLVLENEPVPGYTCDAPINAGPQHFVVKAAIAALERWVRDGTPPPVAPRLEIDAGAPVSLVRDEHGNALGGIRTPQLDVPLATFSGAPQTGSIICALFGSTTPFDDATLATLYPTQTAYVEAFNAAADGAVESGFVLAPDAVLMKAAAADVDVGGT